MKIKLRYLYHKSIDNRIYRYKYFGKYLQTDRRPLKQLQVGRALRSVKYMANITHVSNDEQQYEPTKVDVFLGKVRNIPGNILVSTPFSKINFLRYLRRMNTLTLSNIGVHPNQFKLMNKFIKKYFIKKSIHFSFQNPNQNPHHNQNQQIQFNSIKDILKISKIYTRRRIYGFHMDGLSDDHLKFSNFRELQKINLLHIEEMNVSLLSDILMQSQNFNSLSELQLGHMPITNKFPSMIYFKFKNFQNLYLLNLKMDFLHVGNGDQWLASFIPPVSLRQLGIELNNIKLPNVTFRTDEYDFYEAFGKNLENLPNLEGFMLNIFPIQNFKFINNIFEYLPKTLDKLKDLRLRFQVSKLVTEKVFKMEDCRIIMKNCFEWAFTMKNLEGFTLKSTNRDFSGISDLTLPQNLQLRKFDILFMEEDSTDTLKPKDYAALINLFSQSKMEKLYLSIEASSFDLDYFKRLCDCISNMISLRVLELHLNCRKFSVDEYSHFEAAIRHLKKLDFVDLWFICQELTTVELVKHNLLNLFKSYRRLNYFNINLYANSIKKTNEIITRCITEYRPSKTERRYFVRI